MPPPPPPPETPVPPEQGGSEPSRASVIPEPPPEKPTARTPKATTPRKPRKPNYELLTDVQLARKIKTFGFKPIKRRSAMISLLDQCWESQQQATTPPSARAFSTSVVAESPKRATPTKTVEPVPPVKRPRGRPKKVTTEEAASSTSKPKTKARAKSPAKTARAKKGQAKKAALIEIPDSDDILDEQLSAGASTPCGASSPEPVFSPTSPASLDLSSADAAEMSLALTPPTDNEEVLFKHVTDIVKATPRSTNPAEPSWHERMLLYDPIVVEDFAAWLNSGELTKVGYDAEVSAADV
ncbi:hypothetical protein Micbo1qcDRAFT_158400, partial [Microdochium bolleyi]